MDIEAKQKFLTSKLEFVKKLHKLLSDKGLRFPDTGGKESNRSKTLLEIMGPDRKLSISKDDPYTRELMNCGHEEIENLIKARLACGSWPKHIKRLETLERQVIASNDMVRIPTKANAAHCVTPDTEVLTPKGWQRIEDWEEQTPIMYWASEKLLFGYAKKNVFDIEEPIINIKRRAFEAQFTLNHKIPYYYSKGTKYLVKEASYLASLSRVELINTSIYTPNSPQFDSPQLQFFVMVQADGSFQGRKTKTIRFHFKKVRKINRCIQLLRDLQIRYSTRHWEGGRTAIRILNKDIPNWANIILQTKKLFDNYLLSSSVEARKAFLEELKFWDGYEYDNGTCYYTKQKQNADWVQIIAHITNREASIRSNSWGGFTVRVKNKRKLWIESKHWTEQRYKGKVYCPTTLSGFWIHRYKNTVCISHNTHRCGGTEGNNFYNFPRRINPLVNQIKNCCVCPPTHRIIKFDYNQIEARRAADLAGQKDMVQAFADGKDIYSEFATEFYRQPVRKPKESDDPETYKKLESRRDFGKANILGNQYGKGKDRTWEEFKKDETFEKMIKAGEITFNDIARSIKLYRTKYYHIPAFWTKLEQSFLWVFKNKTESTTLACGISIHYEDDLDQLVITLPSGACLYYQEPRMTARGSIAYRYTHSEKKALWGGFLCLSGNTLIVTDKGPTKLKHITLQHKIWDGQQWVRHRGLVYKGKQTIIEIDGIQLTPDHKIMTTKGWKNAGSAQGFTWKTIRLPNHYRKFRFQWKKLVMESPLRLWRRIRSIGEKYNPKAGSKRLSKLFHQRQTYNTWNVCPSGILGMEVYAGPMPTPISPSIQKLWGAWNKSMSTVERILRGVFGRYGSNIRTWINYRPNRQRRRLYSRKLSLDYPQKTSIKSTKFNWGGLFHPFRTNWNSSINIILPPKTQSPIIDVYDLIDCGPNHCFTVLNKYSQPQLVHNCENVVQSDCGTLLREKVVAVEKELNLPVILDVYDSIYTLVPKRQAAGTFDIIKDLLLEVPSWMKGMPLAVEGEIADCLT